MVQLFNIFRAPPHRVVSVLQRRNSDNTVHACRSEQSTSRGNSAGENATLSLCTKSVSPLSTNNRSLARALSILLRQSNKMDSNSNSCDFYFPKTEIDSENEKDNRREPRLNWSSENTMKLIQTMEKDCQELWDSKHPLNRERTARQAKLEYLADLFGTTSEEISRKIHNLRTQFNTELRKIKRRMSTSLAEGNGAAAGSGWEYFDALSFLKVPPGDPLDVLDAVNLELAEFQAKEEEEFAALRARNSAVNASPTNRPKAKMRVAVAGPPPLPLSAHPLMWSEELVPKLRPSLDADEYQIFGDFVASELRMLRSVDARKRLKRMIQKAILQVGEEEDENSNR